MHVWGMELNHHHDSCATKCGSTIMPPSSPPPRRSGTSPSPVSAQVGLPRCYFTTRDPGEVTLCLQPPASSERLPPD